MKITDVHYYDDIINLPHHVSPKRAKMSLKDRGAQFGSFEALSGHSDAVSETARLTYEKIELSDYAIEVLNSKLMYIKDKINLMPQISLVYFKKDDKKNGGKYVSHKGRVKKINEYTREIIFDDGIKVFAGDIYDIRGECFETDEEFFS